MANKVPGFRIKTSCIKVIKSTYKAKVGSNSCRMRGMTQYQEAERKARREASKTRVASMPEPGAGATEEHPVRRTRHALPKHPRASASYGEPSSKKARKGSEAEDLARMPEIIPPSTEEQEEEEEEEEAVFAIHPRGLRSRSPTIFAEGEPAGQSPMAEGAHQPATSLAQERGIEEQQPGSLSVLMPTSRAQPYHLRS